MAVVGGIGQKERLTVEPDQAKVAEPPHSAFNDFLVADLPAHFGHRAVAPAASVVWGRAEARARWRPKLGRFQTDPPP